MMSLLLFKVTCTFCLHFFFFLQSTFNRSRAFCLFKFKSLTWEGHMKACVQTSLCVVQPSILPLSLFWLSPFHFSSLLSSPFTSLLSCPLWGGLGPSLFHPAVILQWQLKSNKYKHTYRAWSVLEYNSLHSLIGERRWVVLWRDVERLIFDFSRLLPIPEAHFFPSTRNQFKRGNPSSMQESEERDKQCEPPPSLSLSSLSEGGLAGTRLSSSPGESHNGRLAALIPTALFICLN